MNNIYVIAEIELELELGIYNFAIDYYFLMFDLLKKSEYNSLKYLCIKKNIEEAKEMKSLGVLEDDIKSFKDKASFKNWKII